MSSSEEPRDYSIDGIWKAIRSLRERLDNQTLRTSERLISLEGWRIHFETQHNDLRKTLEKIELMLETIRLYQSEQRATEKVNGKLIAIYSAIGGGTATTAIAGISKITGLL